MTATRVWNRDLILIGFADALSAPEVAWSLIEAGYRVFAVQKSGRYSALASSRLVKIVSCADPAEDAGKTVSDWAELIEKYRPAGVFPLDDESLWVVNQIENSDFGELIGAKGECVEAALDKGIQLKAAKAAGFSIPATFEVIGAVSEGRAIEFPVILKPAEAISISGDKISRGRFGKAYDRDALEDLVQRNSGGRRYLVQTLVDGVGEGVFGLAKKGEVVVWSGHRRVRMMNPAGSGSSACASREPRDEETMYASAMLKELGWDGLFMIELLRDDLGNAWFMELNGRPWGSMALSRRSGFEYPAWAVSCQFGEGIGSRDIERSSFSGCCRHIGRELVHILMVFRGKGKIVGFRWPSRLNTIKTVLSWKSGDRLYNWNSADPLVIIADTANSARLTWLWKLIFTTCFLPMRKIRRRIRLWRMKSDSGRASGISERLSRAGSILFLCYGNINRSAVAQLLLYSKVGTRCEIVSCGFHDVVGRDIDPQMRKVAEENGLSIGGWSSRRIDPELVADADMVLAMDYSHLLRFEEGFPEEVGKAVLLGEAVRTGGAGVEVKDPFGHNMDTYKNCYDELDQATDALARVFFEGEAAEGQEDGC